MWNGMSVYHNGPSATRFTLNGALNMFEETNTWFDFGNVSTRRDPLYDPVHPLQLNTRPFSSPSTIRWPADLMTDEFNLGQVTNLQQRKNGSKRNNPDNLSRPLKASKVKQPKACSSTVHIERCLRSTDWMEDLKPFEKLEKEAQKYFADPQKDWFIGNAKKSFTYLLLDPRVTKNLPARANRLSTQSQWTTFIKSIFYVGKGKNERPYRHLTEALPLWENREWTEDKKLQTILDIWKNRMGVICLQVFHNIIPAEAYTYEAAIIDALGLRNLTNLVSGSYKGIVESWTEKEQRMLGIYLLYKAMETYFIVGERQLRPEDI